MDTRGNSSLDFSFNMDGIDRQALLAEAAERLDALSGYLDDSETSSPQSPEGELVRALMGDTVKLSFPEVYEITDQDFLISNLSIPVRFKQLSQAFKFYWLYFPISLFPQYNWGFNRLLEER